MCSQMIFENYQAKPKPQLQLSWYELIIILNYYTHYIACATLSTSSYSTGILKIFIKAL